MRQSATFTTKQLSDNGGVLIVRTPKPLSRGKALIQARTILGPGAEVGHSHLSRGMVFITSTTGVIEEVSYEKALELAKSSDAAKAWSELQTTRANEIASAEELAGRAVLALRMEQSKTLHDKANLRKVRILGSGKCGCGRIISKNKTHCSACPEPEHPNAKQIGDGMAQPDGGSQPSA